jgi:glycosyltransferase involved in cell wall biosynthesis
MQDRISDAIEGIGDTRVIFTGVKKELAVYYHAADLFLLTSREDPFPSVVLDALNASLPVVAFNDGGGYVDVIIPDKTGFLVPMEDVDELSDVVLHLLNNDEKRINIGKYASALMKERASFNNYVFTLLSLLDEKFMKVSVVIPNYNYAKYLDERICSILNQTYPIYEIIILDDASLDESKRIIKSYESQYPLRIKTIINEQNSGNVFSQWEKGLAQVSGEYVWIAEADDVADTQFLESLMDVMSSDTDIVMGYSQSRMINENGEILEDSYLNYTNDIDTERFKVNFISNGHDEIKRCLSIKNTIPNVSAVVFKNNDNLASIVDNVKHYKVAGDWLFYIDILRKGGKLFFSSQSLNSHRRHTSSVTHELNAKIHLDEICECQQYIADLYYDGELSESAIYYRERVKEYLFNHSAENNNKQK